MSTKNNNENWDEIDENSYEEKEEEKEKQEEPKEKTESESKPHQRKWYNYNKRRNFMPRQGRGRYRNNFEDNNEYYFSKALQKPEEKENSYQPQRQKYYNRGYNNKDYYNKREQYNYDNGKRKENEQEGRTPIIVEKTDGTKRIIFTNKKNDETKVEYSNKK